MRYTRRNPRTGRKETIKRKKKSWIMHIPDRGKRGRTPVAQQWFAPTTRYDVSNLGGWQKTQAEATRHKHLKEAHTIRMRKDKKYASMVRAEADKRDTSTGAVGARITFHHLIGLANVTTDKTTERKLRKDADWFIDYARRKHGDEKMRRALATR